MLNFIFGVFFGIVVATIGFSGVATYLDKFVNETKTVVKENVK
jgi:hypothetical protein